MQNDNYDFELKLPRTYLYFAIAVIFASAGLAVAYGVMYAFGKTDKIICGLVVGVAGLFTICGIIGSYMLAAEKFSLKNGVFEYTAPFKRKQIAAVKDVFRVHVKDSKHKNMQDIEFLDKNGGVLMKFTDAGMVLDTTIFVRTLDHYKIPVNDDLDD